MKTLVISTNHFLSQMLADALSKSCNPNDFKHITAEIWEMVEGEAFSLAFEIFGRIALLLKLLCFEYDLHTKIILCLFTSNPNVTYFYSHSDTWC